MQLVAAVKALATARALTVQRGEAQRDIKALKHDILTACDFVAGCTESQIFKNEPDRDPRYSNWIAGFKMPHGSGPPLYVKVALGLPNLDSGHFLSFHPWGRTP